MDPSLQSFLGKIKGKIETLLIILALVSMYFSFLGAELLADAGGISWLNRSNAVIYAIGIGAAVYTFWAIAMRIVPTLPAGRYRYAGMCITAAGCLFLVALSSWLNVAGLAGPAALDTHMIGQISAYEEATASAYGRARQAEQLIGDLKAHSRRFQSLSEDERSFGRISGAPGPGTVSETLADIATDIEALVEEVKAYLDAAATLSEQARLQLETMRQQAARNEPPVSRMRALAGTADALRATLHELQSKSPAASAARVVRSLSAGIAVKPVSGRSSRIIKAQRDALAAVQAQIDTTATAIAALAADLGGPFDPSAGAPVVERIGPVEAVFRYAGKFVPMWAGGIAIDLIPTIIILYLMLVFAVREDGEREKDRLGPLTVEQIEDAQRALLRLRKPPTLTLPPAE
tara:strand:- start:875 stop:2089 length:1215 start_codon:yes stop_codon:yes gene_type:complete